jgi:hypothetical protein
MCFDCLILMTSQSAMSISAISPRACVKFTQEICVNILHKPVCLIHRIVGIFTQICVKFTQACGIFCHIGKRQKELII